MGVINLAHGSFYMLGAYLAFALAPLSATGSSRCWLAGVVLAVVFGYLLEWAFFSYLYQRDHLQQVLMTYALILVFEELRSLLVGNDVHGVQAPAWLAGSFRARRADDLSRGTASSPRRPASCSRSACTSWSTARGWA